MGHASESKRKPKRSIKKDDSAIPRKQKNLSDKSAKNAKKPKIRLEISSKKSKEKRKDKKSKEKKKKSNGKNGPAKRKKNFTDKMGIAEARYLTGKSSLTVKELKKNHKTITKKNMGKGKDKKSKDKKKKSNKKEGPSKRKKNLPNLKGSKKKLDNRQSTASNSCDGNPSCLDLAVIYINLLRGKVATYQQQKNRVNKLFEDNNAKQSKRDIFSNTFNQLTTAGGGDASNLTCGTSTTNPGTDAVIAFNHLITAGGGDAANLTCGTSTTNPGTDAVIAFNHLITAGGGMQPTLLVGLVLPPQVQML
jgi:hypothetical protein